MGWYVSFMDPSIVADGDVRIQGIAFARFENGKLGWA